MLLEFCLIIVLKSATGTTPYTPYSGSGDFFLTFSYRMGELTLNCRFNDELQTVYFHKDGVYQEHCLLHPIVTCYPKMNAVIYNRSTHSAQFLVKSAVLQDLNGYWTCSTGNAKNDQRTGVHVAINDTLTQETCNDTLTQGTCENITNLTVIVCSISIGIVEILLLIGVCIKFYYEGLRNNRNVTISCCILNSLSLSNTKYIKVYKALSAVSCLSFQALSSYLLQYLTASKTVLCFMCSSVGICVGMLIIFILTLPIQRAPTAANV